MNARAPRRLAGGFTLIELMISLVIAGLAVGFIFRIYATSSVAYRTQSQVAELQQTLRTAKQLLTHDLRLAGYYTGSLNTIVNTGLNGNHSSLLGSTPAGVYMYLPITVTNSSSGPDSFVITYGDSTCVAPVPFNTTFAAGVTAVSRDCLVAGDVIAAVRVADGPTGSSKGWGCILKVTSVAAGTVSFASTGAPYNSATNAHCENISPDWGKSSDSSTTAKTVLVRLKQKGYRIKPSDARGVLQVSATGGAVNDWQDLAFGFVDMQVALQVSDGNATDEDGLNGTASDWYSGANMASLPSVSKLLQARVNLVARTVAEVEGVGTMTTPAMGGDNSRPNNNAMGDRSAVVLSTVTDNTSPYYGNYVYRMVTTVVDLRNIGTGTLL